MKSAGNHPFYPGGADRIDLGSGFGRSEDDGEVRKVDRATRLDRERERTDLTIIKQMTQTQRAKE